MRAVGSRTTVGLSAYQFERDYLVKVLRMAGGNVAQAARIAQRNRTDLYKLLQRHELRPERFKTGD